MLVIGILSIPSAYGDATFERLRLQIGERRLVALPESSDLNLSRRGIVDVQIAKDKLAITALKSGTVMITFTVRNDWTSNQKILVSVVANSSKSLGKNELAILASSVDMLFSGHNASLKHLAGETLILTLDCRGKQASYFQRTLKTAKISTSKRSVVVRCRPSNPAPQMLVAGRVVLSKEDLVQRHGVEATLSPRWDLKGLSQPARISAVLDNEVIRHHARVLAEPEILIRLNEEAQVESGFEELHVTSEAKNYHNRYVWKNWGFLLKLKAKKFYNNNTVLSYKFTLSNPSRGRARSYSRGHMSSEVVLPLGQKMVVGSVFLNLESSQKGALYYLQSLPILGPLFRRNSENTSKSRVYLELSARLK